MTADEIVNSLDEQHKLFVFMSEGLLKGYLYLQIYENTKNAEIKYFLLIQTIDLWESHLIYYHTH